MGICASCDSAADAPDATAKLILQDGELREFPRPVRASRAVEKDPAWFVCDSDAMEFGAYVSSVGADDELRPGQLYFVLPESMLRHPLQAEELAALAVKASAALMRAVPAGKHRRRRRSVAPLVFAAGYGADVAGGGGSGVPAVARGRRCSRNGGKGRNFMSGLSAIPE